MKYAIIGFVLGIISTVFSYTLLNWTTGLQPSLSDNTVNFNFLAALTISLVYAIMALFLGIVIEKTSIKK